MPNWAEGSLKLRGRSENIASALKEMLLNDTVTLENDGMANYLHSTTQLPIFTSMEQDERFLIKSK